MSLREYMSNAAIAAQLCALAQNIHHAAGLQWAYEIGHDQIALARSGWYPGCGFEATQALLACEWCGEFYAADSLETKQALDCAASLSKQPDGSWHLYGHYGSRRHDMMLYKWVDRFSMEGHHHMVDDELVEIVRYDPICDRCIDNLLATGKIVLINENVL